MRCFGFCGLDAEYFCSAFANRLETVFLLPIDSGARGNIMPQEIFLRE